MPRLLRLWGNPKTRELGWVLAQLILTISEILKNMISIQDGKEGCGLMLCSQLSSGPLPAVHLPEVYRILKKDCRWKGRVGSGL
jgi:hypothetical protein